MAVEITKKARYIYKTWLWFFFFNNNDRPNVWKEIIVETEY